MRTHILTPIILSLLIACQESPDDSTPDKQDMSSGAVDMTPGEDMTSQEEMSAAADMMTSPPPCEASNLDACRYSPTKKYQVDPNFRLAELRYEDITGATRVVPFEVRLPKDLDAPAPVIIWSHGGTGGKSNPSIVAEEWGALFNRAGYIVIVLAHDRDAATEPAVCTALGATQCTDACTRDADCAPHPITGEGICNLAAGVCSYIKMLNWDRPHDIKQLIDLMEEKSDTGGRFSDLVDTSRILYAGHSAGAGSTMMVSGVARNFADARHLLNDPRPVGFLSFSPQPIGDDGLDAAGYRGDDCDAMSATCARRPHMVVTGLGDGTKVDEGSRRREAFRTLRASENKTLLFIKEDAAQHTTFNHEVEGCERYAKQNELDTTLYPGRCKTYHAWMEPMVVAFLDAWLRDDERAKAYLASDHAVTLSAGVMDIERR